MQMMTDSYYFLIFDGKVEEQTPVSWLLSVMGNDRFKPAFVISACRNYTIMLGLIVTEQRENFIACFK